ncbi:hypothetical protein QTG54_016066 [Skeletonema marinoi]|uniref:Uncharacterized protein n=1 Tax=Skeletonema marinoi TaxID=267567 RepID=A0AAD8XSU4_9STRA|nr:hypothetical protein QTG54_016066 [Skeletonema marinoi]
MSNHSYINSKQTPPRWNAELASNFNYSKTQIIDAIGRNEIASITFLNTYGDLETIHAPHIGTDDHGIPNMIYGNANDDMRTPSFTKIDPESFGFFLIMSEGALHDGFSTNANLTREHLRDTDFSGRNLKLGGFPNFLALPHGIQPPVGELDQSKVNNTRSRLGSVAGALMNALFLAMNMSEQEAEDLRVVGEIILSDGTEGDFITPSIVDQIVLTTPRAVSSHSSTLPQDVSTLNSIFKLPATPVPAHLPPPPAHLVVPQQQQRVIVVHQGDTEIFVQYRGQGGLHEQLSLSTNPTNPVELLPSTASTASEPKSVCLLLDA